MTRSIAIAFMLAAMAAPAARAGGPCLETRATPGLTLSVETLEVIAKDPAAKDLPYGDNYEECAPEAVHVPRLARRIGAACTKILARDPHHALCIDLAALLGKRKLAGVDIEAIVTARPLDPWGKAGKPTLTLEELASLHVTQAAPKIVAAWQASLDRGMEAMRAARTVDPGSDHYYDVIDPLTAWSDWCTEAANALGVLGGPAEREFLDAQAKALAKEPSTDRYAQGLRQAARAASAAIARRTHHR